MQKVLFGFTAALVLMTTSAFAADLEVAAPPVAPPPAYTWTGFYVGVEGGAGWNETTGNRSCVNPSGVTFGLGCTPNIQSNVVSPAGGLVGGEAGYNLQRGLVVYGVETDLQWSNITGSATAPIGIPVIGTYTATADMNWFGTTRVRVGFLPTERVMPYFTGGVMYAHESATGTTNFPGGANYPGTGASTRVGGVIGGGLEYAFSRALSAKAEGLYYDTGTLNASFTCPPRTPSCAAGYTEGGAFAMRGALFRAGLNWHFGGGSLFVRN
jgi:outer membrane immunogenic protein